MATWFDLSVDKAPVSWRHIRSMRADPRDALAMKLSGHRSSVFHMALEQSQQQFEAAERIGYQSRPLNLFYGLSQAGRAISAASASLGARGVDARATVWQPSGHGLHFNTTLDRQLGLLGAPIELRTNNNDSFSRLSIALGSPLDVGTITFEEVLSVIPEVRTTYWTTLNAPPMEAQLSKYFGRAEAPDGVSEIEVRLLGFERNGSAVADELRAYLDRFPDFRSVGIKLSEEGALADPSDEGHVILLVAADQLVQQENDRTWYLRGGLRYRGHTYVAPSAGASSEALHPLASWWLCLYSLSMLARYSPSDWMSVLDIRTSKIAAMLEFVLDVAIDSVPQLISEALAELNE